MAPSSQLKCRRPKAWPLSISHRRRRRASSLHAFCPDRSACCLRFAARPRRTDVQPHRELRGGGQPARRHREDHADLVRDHHRQRGRHDARLFRQPARRRRLHRHHRPEGTEGRRHRQDRRRADLRRRLGGKVLAGVNTSESKDKPSGNLTVIDLASKAIDTILRPRRPAELGRAQPRQELPRDRHRERARRGRQRRRHPADAVRQSEDRAARRRRA